MSIRRLVIWITFLAVFAMAARVSVDSDTWWHLRAGQWMVEQRAILQTDHFSYTRLGQPWQYPGWLVQVPMYWLFLTLGPGGLNLWTALMVTLAFVFVWHTLSGGPFLRALVVVLAAATSGVYWAARPYLVTFVFAAVFLWILEDFRLGRLPQGSRRLWLLPLLMMVWANSHGGFAVGFLIWGVYVAGTLAALALYKFQRASLGAPLKDLRLLLTVGLLMTLAVCANPSGPVMLAYPFKTVTIGALQDYIQEWQTPDFHALQVQPFVWLLLLTLGAVGGSRRRLALTDFLLVAGFAYLGLLAGRNLALFALVAPMVLTRHSAPVLAAISRRLGFQGLSSTPASRGQAVLNWILFSILLLGVVFKAGLVFPPTVNEKVFRETLPVDAVAFLEGQNLPGKLFNSYNWGGYLLWALPTYPVFLDGRTDLYTDELIDEWLRVVRSEAGWQAVLDHYGVRLVLLEPNMAVVSRLEEQGWERIYSDGLAVVLRR